MCYRVPAMHSLIKLTLSPAASAHFRQLALALLAGGLASPVLLMIATLLHDDSATAQVLCISAWYWPVVGASAYAAHRGRVTLAATLLSCALLLTCLVLTFMPLVLGRSALALGVVCAAMIAFAYLDGPRLWGLFCGATVVFALMQTVPMSV